MELPKKDSSLLLILCLVFIASRLPVMLYLPLIQDECLYSMMIEEQAHRPTLIPTFLGYPMSWKPPLFFWAYALPSRLPLPLEAAYRFPSFFFGLANIALVYGLLRKAGAGSSIAFLSGLVYLSSLFTIYPDSTVLLDPMAFFFILLSLCFYCFETIGGWRIGPYQLGPWRLGRWRFLIAAALAFTAFWVKLVLAFMIPALAFAYFWMTDKKTIRDWAFLLSLSAVPLALLSHLILMNGAGLAVEAYAGNIGGRVATGEGFLGPLKMLSTSFTMLIMSGGIVWLSFSLFGFWKHWRNNIFMGVWYLFTIFPFFASSLLPWYYLPAMPAIAFFAILTLASWDGKEKLDRFFYIVFILLMVVVWIPTFFIIKDSFSENFVHKEVGTFLSDKEGVSVVGTYAPGIVAYKVLPELRSGRVIDFGWIVIPDGAPSETSHVLTDDYHSVAYPVRNGSFSPLFTVSGIFRKDTNLSAFDFIAISGEPEVHPKKGTLVYNRSNITVYEVK